MYLKRKFTFDIASLIPYINWTYFFHAWQVKNQEEQQRLQQEATTLLQQKGRKYHAHALLMIADANSDGDNLIIHGTTLPLLRQQHHDEGSPCLCLADYVRPAEQGIPDTVGVFATTTDAAMVHDYRNDEYMQMMMQLLADRLAEAAAERLHQMVRTTLWGYAPNESLSISDLHQEKFQGIRPAVGYPSLPDTGVNFIINELLGLDEIGIRLTENGAMMPHASVTGLMIAHLKARYFSIGNITEEQMADYALRRGMEMEEARKFLQPLLTQ
ncbi:MAG: vitamin B12 dependent-methionine synthase activation domain-containing protein [Prevotella sp.]